MNKAKKKLPAYVVVILVIALVAALTAFAVNVVIGDIDNDGVVTNNDVQLFLNYLVANNQAGLVDYNNDGSINILDVIAMKNAVRNSADMDDGWTIGIY